MLHLLALAWAWAEPTPDFDALLADARAVARTDHDLGRDLAEWILDHDPPADVRSEATALIAELPPEVSDWRAVAKVAGWQTLAGAWTLGPAVALSTSRWVHPSITTGGMVIGGAGGATTALLYARRGRLTQTRATAIIGAQQLGTWNGVVTALVADESRFDPALGGSVGLGVGAVGGYLLATLDLDDGAIATAHSGALWGAGLGLAAVFITSPEDPDPATWQTPWIALAVGADLGALGGYGLSSALDISRSEVRMANVGLAFGVAIGGFAVAVANADGEMSEGAIAGTLAVTGVAGGVGGVAAVRAWERGRDRRAVVQLVPRPGPDGVGWALDLSTPL